MRIKNIATILVGVLAVFAISCNGNSDDSNQQSTETSGKDSVSLYVAVYPSEGALPLYFAESSGLLDSLGKDIRIIHLQTMEDCDTSLINNHADVSVSDIARILCMRKNGINATAIAQLKGSLGLYTVKSSRINELKQLKDRTVAIERHSEADQYSDKLIEGASLDRLDIFRTQFNNHKMRMEMLTNKLVDAAFLAEPYASMAENMLSSEGDGIKKLWSSESANNSWNILASLTTTLNDKKRVEQTERLFKIYDLAVVALSDTTKNDLKKAILKSVYLVPGESIDTIPAITKSIEPAKLKAVQPETVEQAKSWLVRRGWIKNSLNTEGIFTSRFCK